MRKLRARVPAAPPRLRTERRRAHPAPSLAVIGRVPRGPPSSIDFCLAPILRSRAIFLSRYTSRFRPMRWTAMDAVLAVPANRALGNCHVTNTIAPRVTGLPPNVT